MSRDDVTIRDAHRLKRRKSTQADWDRARKRLERRRAAVPARIEYPEELPVSARRDDLLAAIRDHQVVIVAGETGSGKTTQLPKICLELGRGVYGSIAHTQPRRLAARTIAERIAEELQVGLGEAVGYSVRFNDRSGENTLLRLMTDGLLLAEIGHDRLLRRYDTIIVDEAHERSLNIDFLLGYLKQLLPQRPDLKVIITSATIDPERFAEHFDDAPIVEVSGRTYPVEVRYRPLDEDADIYAAVGDAVDELPGDVLVFLSGEREIRDAAESLTGRYGPKLEVLPLFARLSTADQQKVFRPSGRGRRVVLATNVAETSVTVPGIRSVVDVGLARISRYSARLKVQRLPIEPVSQASADQRKGRCGRTSDGVCIRLYDEQDFEDRPEFTDPEVLRTNLASVLLQMAALNLGDPEDFPFLDPPDRRQVRDGVNLLTELGAFDAGQQLTPLGRRLARLPVDPRMGRMVLEADRRSCAEEVVIIAAALSIQDPRERPLEHRAHADQLHARFADEDSDFTAYLNLWKYLEEEGRALSRNQFRRKVKSEYIHYLRVREWQDLAEQLRQTGRQVGVTFNQQPGRPKDIAVSLLSGLLSHVGLRDKARREYLGARGARFAIFPGSGQAKKQPDWVMAAELVETSRLFARECARIDPRWIEPLAPGLVRREYSEPRWDEHRGGVVATERVTLYGLPIVAGRAVDYAAIDPVLSRELFIRRALVEGEWGRARHAFLAENRRRIAEVEALEERTRRRGLLAPDEVLHDFFATRIPEDVVSGRHFDRWYREQPDKDILVYPRQLLQAGGADAQDRPTTWKQGEHVFDVSYRFEPGAPDDGATIHIPLADLGDVRDVGFDWLVPGLREELVTTLIRGLPKELRRPLVPIPETAKAILPRLRPRKGRLVDAVARELPIEVSGDAFDLRALPAHLRFTFSIEDAGGAVVARGDDLAGLREQVRPVLREALAEATSGIERSGLTDWPGAIPRCVETPGAAGYPALVDEGDTVGVRVLETPAAQAASMWRGTLRLLELVLPHPDVTRGLSNAQKLTLASHGDIADDVRRAAIAHLTGDPPFFDEDWEALRRRVAGELHDTAARAMRLAVDVLDAAAAARSAMAGTPSEALRQARLDVAAQIGRLTHPGFVATAGIDRLPDVARYLRAAAYRLERLPDNVPADRDRMATVHELEALARGNPEAQWLIEELRVAYFAQGLGVKGQVSAKRVRRALTGG